jgi:hypothetical protein
MAAYAGLVAQWLRDPGACWRCHRPGSDLVGFIVLATRAPDRSELGGAGPAQSSSRQAASYLGQVRATEALVEARKFDSFNRMSALQCTT